MLHLLFATLWHLSGYFSEFLYQLIKIILQDEWISKNDHSYGKINLGTLLKNIWCMLKKCKH